MITITGTIEGVGFLFNGIITGIFVASSARTKCGTKHCTILLVTVTGGKIRVGQEISISINGNIVEDAIVYMEKHKTSVDSAQKDDQVGICLHESSLKKFVSTKKTRA